MTGARGVAQLLNISPMTYRTAIDGEGLVRRSADDVPQIQVVVRRSRSAARRDAAAEVSTVDDVRERMVALAMKGLEPPVAARGSNADCEPERRFELVT